MPGAKVQVEFSDNGIYADTWTVGAEMVLPKFVRAAVAGQPRQELPAVTLKAPLRGLMEHDVLFSRRADMVRGIKRAISVQMINLRTLALDRWPRDATADIYADFEELRPEGVA